MAQIVYVVLASGRIAAAFTKRDDADAYCDRQNQLESQRHPHAATCWDLVPVEVDGLA